MWGQEGSGNGQGEQEVTSPSHYIFEQFQNSYQFRILFTNPEKISELLCPFIYLTLYCHVLHMFFIHQWVVGQDNSEGIHIYVLRYNR